MQKKINKPLKKITDSEQWRRIDIPNRPLIILIIGFFILGLLMIFSASAVLASARYDDPFFFFKKQIALITLGSIAAFIMFILKPRELKKLGILFLIGGLILMIYLVPQAIFNINTPGVVSLNGATRWIRLPIFDVQPAEFIKIAIILFTALWLNLSKKNVERVRKFVDRFKPDKTRDTNIDKLAYFLIKTLVYLFPIFIVGVVALLVLTEKDLSTVVVIVSTFICVYYAGGTREEHTLITIVLIIGSLIIGFAAMTLVSYRQDRLNTFLEIFLNGEPKDKKGGSFQIWNGIIGIGSGGIRGLGYGESRQKLFFLQEPAYTDSIFAVFAEEFGLIGTIVLVLAYIYFLSLGFKISLNSKNKFMGLVGIGITSLISIQAFFNIGANLAVIPFGGIPLPFISYGGSYTITTLILIGILLNISKQSNQSDHVLHQTYNRN